MSLTTDVQLVRNEPGHEQHLTHCIPCARILGEAEFLEKENTALKAKLAVAKEAVATIVARDRTTGYPTGPEWMALVAMCMNALKALQDEGEK